MIYSLPSNWRDLQNKVCDLLIGCGFEAEVEKTIDLVRGKTEIDVFAADKTQSPEIIYLCECKFWSRNVPQDEIMTFRTKINDHGANTGFIISKVGFQKGAFDVAQNTNVKLVTWEEFQDIFFDKWLKFMSQYLYDNCYAIRDYTDPFDSFMLKKAERLNQDQLNTFRNLQKKYMPLSAIIGNIKFGNGLEMKMPQELILKIENDEYDKVAVDCFFDLFKVLFEESNYAINEFDNVFGEKIRFYNENQNMGSFNLFG